MSRNAGKKQIILILLTAAITVFADQMIEGWQIVTGDKGKISTMVFNDPTTYLSIEQQLRFEIGNQGTPQRGSVKFRNGVERGLGDKEMISYWENLKGEHALWEYYFSHGYVASFTPAAGIPTSCFGKRSRVFTMNNLELFGRLLKSSNESELFLLEVDGACCGPIHFSANGTREVQQMK